MYYQLMLVVITIYDSYLRMNYGAVCPQAPYHTCNAIPKYETNYAADFDSPSGVISEISSDVLFLTSDRQRVRFSSVLSSVSGSPVPLVSLTFSSVAKFVPSES